MSYDDTLAQKILLTTASLNALESSQKQLEKERDDTMSAIAKAEQEGKPIEEINQLKHLEDATGFAIWITGLTAEDISDGRDKIKKKDLKLQDKRGQIVILGLDHAGKTTLLRTLKDNDPLAQLVSTLYENSEELIIRNIKFVAFNLSGRHAQAGREWKNHLSAVDSIVFLIDATDRNRFALAKAELNSLLSDEQLASVPITILGTKSDLEAAIDEEELREEFGLVSATEEIIDDEELHEEPGLVSATEEIIDGEELHEEPGLVLAAEEVIDDGELHEELGLVSTTEKSTSDRSDKDSGRQIQLFMCDVREQETFGQAFRWLGNYLKDI